MLAVTTRLDNSKVSQASTQPRIEAIFTALHVGHIVHICRMRYHTVCLSWLSGLPTAAGTLLQVAEPTWAERCIMACSLSCTPNWDPGQQSTSHPCQG